MEIPSLPTDNLYKFLALSGVAIILLSIGFVAREISELKPKVSDATTQTEILASEVDYLEKKLEASKKANSTSPETTVQLDSEKQALMIKRIQHKGHVKLLATLVSDVETEYWFMVVSVAFGFALSVLGFSLWYKRVQRPSDLLLARQFEHENS